MYKELKIKVTNQFSFSTTDSLEEVCASEGSGVFLVYAVGKN
jgi:hypothetical protein